MATKQADALAQIDAVTAIDQAFVNLYWRCKQFAAQQANNDYVTTWNNQPTYALNTDGSQGATDASPNTSHPIVGKDVAAADLSAFIGYGLNDFITFVEGTGAVTQADRRPALNKLLP